MAVKHLSYLDLTPKQRQEGAQKGRERVQALLMSPFLTGDQIATLHKQLERIDQWERGEISVPPRVKAPATIPSPALDAASANRQPTHHVVNVGETLQVTEKIN